MDNVTRYRVTSIVCTLFFRWMFYCICDKSKELFSRSFICFIFVLLHVLPAFPGNVCRFISLFLAFHQGGHSAHCRISRREETQRPSLSSPWPRGLIFKGASCAMSPYDNKKTLRMPQNCFQFNSSKWKFMESSSQSYRTYFLWLLLLIAIGFSLIRNLVSRVRGENEAGTWDLERSDLFSYHLSLQEVYSNYFI